MLELAVTTTDVEGALSLAERLHGAAYVDHRSAWQHLAFRALVTVVTDDLEPLTALGDVGLHVVYRRLIKPGPAGVFGLFPLVRNPRLSHQQADAHWRDVHGPLALEHHAWMSHYAQLSVVANLGGLALDGFALCGFETEDDLRDRFYTSADSPAVIAGDVAKFADPGGSPRRLVAIEHAFTAG